MKHQGYLSRSSESKSFSIRRFEKTDEDTVVALGEKADMGRLSGFQHTEVAVKIDTEEILGFCRIRIFNGVAHVSPIVVSKEAQGLGVGTALMEHCVRIYGELRFVARGYAVPFYRSLGCTEIGWDEISHEAAEDCTRCSSAASCNPLPMVMRMR